MAAMGIIGGVIGLVGSIVSAAAMQRQAAAERNAAEYNAQVNEQRAMMERAAAQRTSLEKKEKKDYALSALQARAAASGGGAGVNDPTVINLATEIEGKGEYAAMLDMYSGEQKGRYQEAEADIGRYIGEEKAKASEVKAFGTILGGVGFFVGKFG